MTSPDQTDIFSRFTAAFTHRSMREWALFVKASGISMPQFGILMQLHHKGQCGVSDISERMDISNAAASQLVEKLVQAGLLERTEDPHDRRAKQLSLTERGRTLLEKGLRQRGRWLAEVTASLEEADQRKISEALGLLIRATERLEAREESHFHKLN